MPQPIPDDIRALIDELVGEIRRVLGDKLVGVYVYGSLVWGDFDHDISDIDMLAAVEEDVTEDELSVLREMHDQFARRHPDWDDRIEVQYYATTGLRNFRMKSHPMAVISPGEPLHIVEAGSEWFLNWYFVLTYGVTIVGPPPAALIPPLTKQEFVDATIEHARQWNDYVRSTQGSRHYQGYAVMTLCRALYTATFGEQVSKRKAADWAADQLPQYADLIRSAFEWRASFRNKSVDPSLTYPQVKQFVAYMVSKVDTLS